MNSRPDRIAPIDGLRAVAVVGVMWAHVWSFGCGAPAMLIPGVHLAGVHIDVNRIISMFGTGVDLFFVISGFCMYTMYARHQRTFSLSDYGAFIVKRWYRIAPAFYVAIAGSAIFFYLKEARLPLSAIAANLVFAQLWVPRAGELNPVFWSLATEWHFYLVLPFFVWAVSRLRFWPALALLGAVSIVSRVVQCYALSDVSDSQLPFRLIEFTWGIAVARLYADHTPVPSIFRGSLGAILALGITYVGRTGMASAVLDRAGRLGPFALAMSAPVLTLGYAILMWNVIASPSLISRALAMPAMRAVGRYSYSIYLWHFYPSLWIASVLVRRFGTGPWMPHLATALALAAVLPIAKLSYRWFEAPYFKGRRASAGRAQEYAPLAASPAERPEPPM